MARRLSRSPVRITLAFAALLIAALTSAATAAAAPSVTGVHFFRPAVTGRLSQLDISATDPNASIGGVSIAFGRSDGTFALSACRPVNSRGRRPGGAFAPGAATRFRIPHVYHSSGARPVLIKLNSGGCAETGSTVIEEVTITPTPPGTAPVQPSKPVVLAVSGLPGSPSAPSTPGVPQVPGVPQIPGVPSLPGLPSGLPLPVQVPSPPLPGLGAVTGSLPSVPSLKVAAHRRRHSSGCRFANQVPSAFSGASIQHARSAVLCLLNVQRRSFHLAALRENNALDKAAALHDSHMIQGGYFSHDEPGGLGLVNRLQEFRYITPRVAWTVGENLGAGVGPAASPSALVAAWMASTEHRANILDAGFRQIGIAIAAGVPGSGPSGLTYVTDFGARH